MKPIRKEYLKRIAQRDYHEAMLQVEIAGRSPNPANLERALNNANNAMSALKALSE